MEIIVAGECPGWEGVALVYKSEPLNEPHAALGNTVAIDAHRAGILPFSGEATLVKLAGAHTPSDEGYPRPWCGNDRAGHDE